jgi:hypothetical protein
MRTSFLLFVTLAGLNGCCCCEHESKCPPLNCMGLAYDGSGSPCFRPRGPFWCCLPGPCSTCRDPWVRYYEESHANWIGRHVCNDCDPGAGIDGYQTMGTFSPPRPTSAPQAPGRILSVPDADDE